MQRHKMKLILENWLEAIKSSENLKQTGAWYMLLASDGEPIGSKFQAATWTKRLEDEGFKNRVFEIMDEEIIMKFDARVGDAKDFYDVDKE